MNDFENFIKAVNFAAKKHKDQKRKGDNSAPYINHPIEVANLLVQKGRVTDNDILIAAILHDTVEDTDTTKEEIYENFGEKIGGYVMEVTDDKSLPKQERKQLQIEHAPHLSEGAKLIKLADKISNITDVVNEPPSGWSQQRRLEYVEWGEKVAAGLRGKNQALDEIFDNLVVKAKKDISAATPAG